MIFRCSLFLWACLWPASGAALYGSKLEKSRVSPVYRRRLEREYEEFLSWLGRQNSLPQWNSLAWANQLVATYVNHLYESGTSFSRAKHASVAIQTAHHHLRGRLQRPWDALRAWKARLPNKHRLPIVLEVLQCLFIKAIDWALASPPEGFLWLCLGLGLRVGFFGLLRAGELLKLKMQESKLQKG